MKAPARPTPDTAAARLVRAPRRQAHVALVLLAGSFAHAEPRIAMQGFGAVRVGMTVAQARHVAPGGLLDQGAADRGCYYLTLGADPRVAVMVVDEIVVRIDVGVPGVPTVSGLQVGDPEERVRAAFGQRLRAENHHYVEGGNYLVVDSLDRKLAVVFETDGNVVTAIRAGAYPSVAWVEGCS